MLQNTFIHIQSIGAITEQRLWESGLRNWDAFTDDISIPLSGKRKYLLQKGIEESKRHLSKLNPSYFSKLLSSNQCCRLFPEFRESTIYLDIETTGLDRYFNDITTIALYDGESIQTYVQGQNLEDFIEEIEKYKVIVSYNGKSFDIPFIEYYFNIRLDHAHIDLRYVLYSLGFRGGLKGCERQLGMDRGNLSDIDGFFAVLLWEEYQKTGDQRALETLFEKMIQTDAIVYASPLYCWGFTSQIKPLNDRHFCLVSDDGTPDHSSLISGRPAALLVTCAGPIEGNCDPIRGVFKGFTDYLQLTEKGSYILPFCTTPDAISDNGDELAKSLADAITE